MDGPRSKGFGFVSFSNEDDRNSAMSSLDGTEIMGRPIRVSIAVQRQNRNRSNYNNSGGRDYYGSGRDDFRGSRDNFGDDDYQRY